MSRFDLLYDIKRTLSNAVDLDDMVAALFADYPDLIRFQFEVTNEYDDNNYSDYTRLKTVNGWSVDYDGEYEDEDEGETSDIPKASNKTVHQVTGVEEYVKEKHGLGDHEFHRDDYTTADSEKRLRNDPNLQIATACINGTKVPIETLLKADEKWVLHYARVHGRYSPEDEFTLIGRKKMMWIAEDYAEEFGPIEEKTLNYFILSITSGDDEYSQLREYLDWLKERAERSQGVARINQTGMEG